MSTRTILWAIVYFIFFGLVAGILSVNHDMLSDHEILGTDKPAVEEICDCTELQEVIELLKEQNKLLKTNCKQEADKDII